MRYAKELENLERAEAELKSVRHWCERAAGGRALPDALGALENALVDWKDEAMARCETVRKLFESKHGFYHGTHISVWNPSRPRWQANQRAYIRGPDAECDAPHMTKTEYETINGLLGCEAFAFDADFTVYVMDGRNVFKELKGTK